MSATRNMELNEIRALSAVELDTVAGGATTVGYAVTVAGMRISGNYDTDSGSYGVVVDYGGKWIAQGGKVFVWPK
jgi:hypothetical protein